MVRERLPAATTIAFWHIPWPNPEAFAICPWRDELLDGLLGSSILGFHTQFHCNNFFETVDRFVESRIDREHASVISAGHETMVRAYPISIEWPPKALVGQPSIEDCRSQVRQALGIAPDVKLAVGIERFDYTKGILDRMRAVDDLLTREPTWSRRFTFVQVAAPTRSKLASYSTLQSEALALVDDDRHSRPEEKVAHLPVRFDRRGEPRIVVDTSAIIDGRIAEIVESGFIYGTLVIPRFVLDELQHIADSSDALRRNRGRRGLEILNRMQKEPATPVEIVEDDVPEIAEVDAKLVALALARSRVILTNDFNLNRVAELQGVRVMNINSLANAVKPAVLPGEELRVRVIQEGKEAGQGVGFLDDGTMIVIEGGARHIDRELDVSVTRVLQTVAGRMIFAQPHLD